MAKRNISKTQPGIDTFFVSKKTKVVVEQPEVEVETSARDDLEPRNWKIVAWNVAGLRACLKKGCTDSLAKYDADIIFLEETKYDPVEDYKKLKGDDLKNVNEFQKKFKDYHIEWCCSTEKKGYAGVAFMSKVKPINVTIGLGCEDFDGAGRLVFAEFSNFHFIGAYVLNSGRKLVNLGQREKFEELFLEKIKALDATKSVIYGGDLNVAHNEIDLKNPESNRNKTAGFTDQERGWFSRLLENGFKDSFRTAHPETVKYSYWSYLGNSRSKNVGWRLDYWVLSDKLMDKMTRTDIDVDVAGSDHAPIILEITV